MKNAGRLDWLARVGFIARGTLYILFGTIALVWRHSADEGQGAVFGTLAGMTGGSVLLIAGAVGLAAYGLFRLVSAWLDIEGKGSDLKGWGGRLAQAASGIIHLGFAASAVRFLLGWARASHGAGNRSGRMAAKTALELPLGEVWLYAIAAGFVFAAGLQLRKAWKGSHMKQCRPDTPRLAVRIGQVGLLTRGAIFVTVAWSLQKVAHSHQPGQARGVSGAIGELRSQPALYLAVCIGLILFGVFSLLLARYRVVPAIDVVDRAKRELRGS